MNHQEIQKEIAQYGQFTVDVRKEFESRYREEITALFKYAQDLATILGVIAGFGFTAFGYVQSLFLFFAGESLVVGSILYLVVKLKKYTLGQPASTENRLNYYSEKSNQLKRALLKNDNGALVALRDEFEKAINDTTESPKIETTKLFDDSLGRLLFFSIIGIILIFSSFFVCF